MVGAADDTHRHGGVSSAAFCVGGAQDDEVGETAATVISHPALRKRRKPSIVTPSAEVSGAMQLKKHKLPRSFEGQPGPLTIQVPSVCLSFFFA